MAVGFALLGGFILLGSCNLWKAGFLPADVRSEIEGGFRNFLIGIFLGGSCFCVSAYYLGRERYVWLYQENKRFAEIIKASGHLVFCLSGEDGRCLWYGNPEQILGKKKWEMDLEAISHPDDYPVILQQMADTGRGIIYYSEMRLKDEEGGYVEYFCRIVPVENSGKKSGNVVGFLRKIDKI